MQSIVAVALLCHLSIASAYVCTPLGFQNMGLGSSSSLKATFVKSNAFAASLLHPSRANQQVLHGAMPSLVMGLGVKKKMSIAQLSRDDLSGKKVLVRCDFNVPMRENRDIIDDSRIKASLPTIQYLIDNGARVTVCSHLGRPKHGFEEALSMAPIAKRLSSLLGKEVKLCDDTIGEGVANVVDNLQNGQVCLLENLRFHAGCEQNDKDYSRALAAPHEIFVNDAFGTAHRAHSSTVGVTKFLSPSVAGFLLSKELNYLEAPIMEPKRPFAAIIGGFQVSEKIDVIDNLLEKVDTLIIGGGMAYTFMAARGLDVGDTEIEKDKLQLALQIQERARQRGVKFLLPTDVVVADKFDNDANRQVVSVENIPAGHIGLDIGPETVKAFEAELLNSKTILWNGKMGFFQMPNFSHGTFGIIDALGKCTKKGITTIAGGGKTVAAIELSGRPKENFSHISTGGAATLELLEGLILPGVKALDNQMTQDGFNSVVPTVAQV